MNERIKELAKLAQLRAEWMTPQGLEWFDNFKEQFAELIVRECLSYAKDGDIDFMRFMIKKHFGVAEREE
jgi:hypothetical protein